MTNIEYVHELSCIYEASKNKNPAKHLLWLFENDLGTCNEIAKTLNKKGELEEINSQIRLIGSMIDNNMQVVKTLINKMIKISPKKLYL